jgi:hypothetical protein
LVDQCLQWAPNSQLAHGLPPPYTWNMWILKKLISMGTINLYDWHFGYLMVLSSAVYFKKCQIKCKSDYEWWVCKDLKENGHGPPKGYYSSFQLGTLKKAMMHFNQYSRQLRWGSNLLPPKYESRALMVYQHAILQVMLKNNCTLKHQWPNTRFRLITEFIGYLLLLTTFKIHISNSS